MSALAPSLGLFNRQRRGYPMTPGSHAEKQAQHLREVDWAAALLTVALDRQPAIGQP